MNKNIRLKIGLEIHFYFEGCPKLLCSCVFHTHALENTIICSTCIGTPGKISILNPNFKNLAAKLLSYHRYFSSEKVPEVFIFSRKHYMYPDLVKNYQVGCFSTPLLVGGKYSFPGGLEVPVRGVHLEEDSARSYSEANDCFIDLNRSGATLLELVTEPVFTDSESIVKFIKLVLLDLKAVLGYSVNFRVDLNISNISCERVEVKNVNSFTAIKKSIDYEIHIAVKNLKIGNFSYSPIVKRWNEELGKTEYSREKESEVEYHYIRDYDIPEVAVEPIEISPPPSVLFLEINRLFSEISLDFYLGMDPSLISFIAGVLPLLRKSNEIFTLATNWKKFQSKVSDVREALQKGRNILSLLENITDDNFPTGAALEAYLQEEFSSFLKEDSPSNLIRAIKKERVIGRGRISEVVEIFLKLKETS